MVRHVHSTMGTHERGSLLLDMLVAFAIISIALVVVVEAFVTSQKANRVARAQADAAQSLFFLLEDMTSEVWLSDHFATPNSGSCSGGLYMVRVKGVNDQYPDEICYYATGPDRERKIMKRVTAHNMDGTTDALSSRNSDLDITPPTMSVDKFNVSMSGHDKNPAQKFPTTMLINLQALPTTVDDAAPLDLQTTVTAKFTTP